MQNGEEAMLLNNRGNVYEQEAYSEIKKCICIFSVTKVELCTNNIGCIQKYSFYLYRHLRSFCKCGLDDLF